eukprot:2023764-Amphidinium_carterae.1
MRDTGRAFTRAYQNACRIDHTKHLDYIWGHSDEEDEEPPSCSQVYRLSKNQENRSMLPLQQQEVEQLEVQKRAAEAVARHPPPPVSPEKEDYEECADFDP